MGINKSTQITKVFHDGNTYTFYLTKVLEPTLFYFINDQRHIVKNLSEFKIIPTEGEGKESGITLTKIGEDVIITISVKIANKEVLIQFLIKLGFDLVKLQLLCNQDIFKRFLPFTQVIKKAIELTGELDEEGLTIKKPSEGQVKAKKVKLITVKKPRGAGKSED